MNISKVIERLGWAEVTAIQQLCELRKQQIRIREPNVYAVSRKVIQGCYEYIGYNDGNEVCWVSLVDPSLAVYPSFEVAESVRMQQEPGASVCPFKKSEFKTLPSFARHLRENIVTKDGHFNI